MNLLAMTLFCGLCCLPIRAARFEIGELAKIVNVSDPRIAPDGKSIVLVVSRPDYEADVYRSELILVDIATHKQRLLTHGRKGVGYPRWSSSGDRLAFLAHDGNEKPQIFIMPMAGGDAAQLTTANSGVQQYVWRPDGEAIAFTASDEAPKKTGPEKFEDAFEVGNNSYLTNTQQLPSHLWLVATNGDGAKRLTNGSWSLPTGGHDAPFSWSTDSKSIVFVKLATAYSGDAGQSTLQMLDVASDTYRPVTLRNKYEGMPAFSPDGSHIAYLFPRDGRTRDGAGLYTIAAGRREGTDVSGEIDRDIVRFGWMPDGRSLLVGGNDRTTVGLWVQPLEGKPVRLNLGNICPSWPGWWVDVSVGLRGDIAFTGSEPNDPAELYYISKIGATPTRLTDFNSQIASLQLGKTETIEWTSSDEFHEDGVLTFPPSFAADRKYPLVLWIHGGPPAASWDTFSPVPQLLAAQGWLVFQPNYRGSDNLGHKYEAAITGDAGDGPGRDIMAGLQEVKRRGFVDESNIAVTGWSYGGFMTVWLLGHYGGWKTAIAGAAMTDWVDTYTLSDFNLRSDEIFAVVGSPYVGNTMKAYVDQSPITYSDRISTPTLIMSDTADDRVPITQSYRLYHALKDRGVTTKFIAYPIPGHFPGDPVRQRDIFRRWIDWLSQYLSSQVSSVR